MGGDAPPMKRPKLEKDDDGWSRQPSAANGSAPRPPAASASDAPPPGGEDDDELPEEAVLALIAHHEREVERYKLKLEAAERKLAETRSRLARHRGRAPDRNQPPPPPPAVQKAAAPDRRTPSPSQREAPKPSVPSQKPPAPQARPQLVIPGAGHSRPAPRPALPIPKKAATASPGSSSPSLAQAPQRKAEKKPKREIVQKEHQNLIQSVKKSSVPTTLKFYGGTLVSSQHKRKLRCLELCPADDQLVVTSALDGMVTLWQVQSSGPSISLLSTTNCFSSKQRWPEDVAWHPDGDTIFAVYTADGGDTQVSMMNLNTSGQKKVTFLQEKPHTKGLINNINFMPWSDTCFMTGGSDHAVMLWQEKYDSWNYKKVHRDLHSSAVMGVVGLQQRKTIISVGVDKRIISYDVAAERTEYKNMIDSKCLSVLLNPSDFNLYMVQTGSPGRQLRLFDIRLRQTEVHAMGWKQTSSESQSALINQSWSPDGWYLSSGSADPVIHIFDIRYQGQKPCQSVQAHQKRVFKAIWHQTFPVLTSSHQIPSISIHLSYSIRSPKSSFGLLHLDADMAAAAASDLESKAKEAFVDDDFELAAELYTQAIEAGPATAELYADRAQAHIKLGSYTEAVADANKAIELDPSMYKAYLRKGSACIKLEEYQTAKAALEVGSSYASGDSRFTRLMKECDDRIAEEASQVPVKNAAAAVAPATSSGATTVATEAEDQDGANMENAQPTVEVPSKPKYRHDYYNTPTEVVLTIFAKGVPADSVVVDFGEQMLSVSIELPGEEPYHFQPRLFSKIIPDKCKYTVLSTKVEMRLAKAEPVTWTSLDYTGKPKAPQKINVPAESAQRPSYPSSKSKKDWDKLEAEVKKQEKDEKLDGDAALNKFFREIYSDADEDMRRAMMKSFVESNGTVLSTNWKDVGKKTVEGSPPDGMELKKWEY